MNKSNSLRYIDGLRGFAAIYVLIHHSRWLLAENYSLRLNKGILDYLLSIFRFGHEAVIFFFILSGFLIHLSILRSLESGNKISWVNYFVKRINRIYPPFVIALLFTVLVDTLGKFVFLFSTYGRGSKYFGLLLDNQNFSIFPFIGNLLNLQGLVSSIPVFGSNAALWSLSYEWWFYLLYPLFFLIHKRSWALVLAIQFFLFLISAVFQPNYLIFPLIFQKMLIWWTGVLLAEITFRNLMAIKRIINFFLIFIPIAILFFPNNRLIGDVFWGLGFIGFINLLNSCDCNNLVKSALEKISFTGSFSYTLYLMHVPIIFLAHGYLIDKFKGVLPTNYWIMLISIVGIIAFSWISSKWIEKLKFISM